MQDITLSVVGRKVVFPGSRKGFADKKAAGLLPTTVDRRPFLLGLLCWGSSNRFFSPAAPIQSIENAHRAGLGAFTPAQVGGFLSSATSRLRRDRSMLMMPRWAESEGKRKLGVTTFQKESHAEL